MGLSSCRKGWGRCTSIYSLRREGGSGLRHRRGCRREERLALGRDRGLGCRGFVISRRSLLDERGCYDRSTVSDFK